MRASVALLLALALVLPACDPDEDAARLEKEVADVREEAQRVRRENEKLASQLAAQVRRLDGLSGELSTVRQRGGDSAIAPAVGETPSGGAELAAAAAGAPAAGAPLAPGEVVAIRAFLATPEGRRMVTDAIEAEREARVLERARRAANDRVDRFAKTAQLTEDQVKRMKDAMGRAVTARAAIPSLRDLDPDALPEQREALRAEVQQKTDALRQATDDEVKAILSSTQFEQYQKEQQRLRNPARGDANGNGGRQRGTRAGDPGQN